MAEEELRGIVRLAGRDLKGTWRVQTALTKLKGVSASMAKAIAHGAEIEGTKKIGSLDDDQIEKLNDVLHNPNDYDVPSWMLNRRKDLETGEDLHLLGGDIEMAERSDIQRERSIRSRRGIRHERGLPVRGQRTKSTGRKGMSVGVERKKLKEKRKERK